MMQILVNYQFPLDLHDRYRLQAEGHNKNEPHTRDQGPRKPRLQIMANKPLLFDLNDRSRPRKKGLMK